MIIIVSEVSLTLLLYFNFIILLIWMRYFQFYLMYYVLNVWI